ncbi:MAG: thiolase domain-containing protein [Firmicutes bacterium]|nr:thiolase domain-containing protein [Bacillota bacterium]
MAVNVIGTFHSKIGRLDENVYELLVQAGRGALEDAGVAAGDIDGIWIGNFSGGGFNSQEHLAPCAVDIDPALRFKPAVRVENACASGSAAIAAAKNAIEAGEAELALVIGVEKMTSLDTKGVTKVLAMASYWPEEGELGMTFPGLFAEYAKGYMEKYNVSAEELRVILAKVAAKNHRNAVANPLAQMPWECTFQDILDRPDQKNPMVAEPLRLFDCSLVSDGAAALVLASEKKAKELGLAQVELSALVHTTDYLALSKRSNSEFTAGKRAIQKAYELADITVDDLDFAEVHDCFTIAEVLAYEAIGLVPDGEGPRAIDEGLVEVGGKLPINASGGLKAKGHPVGATGVSMAVLAVRQLQGKAIGHQIEGAKVGLTYNIGGSAASNYALIFKRTK